MGIFDDMDDKKDDVENQAHEIKGRIEQKADDMSNDVNEEGEAE
jgi:hypothetical protein